MDATEPSPTPNPEISPAQVVVVVGWLVVATMIAATCTRLVTKVSLKRLLGIDDYLIIAATVSGTAQMAVTFILAKISVKDDVPTGDDWDTFQKALYSSQLLFVPTICFAKLSVLYSLHQITPVQGHKWAMIACSAFVSLILVAFEFATAFQCKGTFWNIFSGNCFNQTPFWQSWGALDIATDAFIVGCPVYVVSKLQIGTRFKVVVAGVFAARVATIAASICRLVYLSRSNGTITPDSFAFWTYILTTEVEQGLSIITSCIPFLKPFFESLETGMLAPSHGLKTVIGASAGSSANRSKRTKQSNILYELRPTIELGINVSSRISTYSEERGLIKEGQEVWVEPMMPPNHV